MGSLEQEEVADYQQTPLPHDSPKDGINGQ